MRHFILILVCVLPHIANATDITKNTTDSIPLKLSDDLPKALFNFNGRIEPQDNLLEPRKICHNKDSSIIACSYQNALQTGFVYLFVTHKNGDLTIMQNINQRVAKLFPKPPNGFAEEYMIVESIDGNILKMYTSTFEHNIKPMSFRVRLKDDNELVLLK